MNKQKIRRDAMITIALSFMVGIPLYMSQIGRTHSATSEKQPAELIWQGRELKLNPKALLWNQKVEKAVPAYIWDDKYGGTHVGPLEEVPQEYR